VDARPIVIVESGQASTGANGAKLKAKGPAGQDRILNRCEVELTEHRSALTTVGELTRDRGLPYRNPLSPGKAGDETSTHSGAIMPRALASPCVVGRCWPACSPAIHSALLSNTLASKCTALVATVQPGSRIAAR
jgi:hypothetical protein